MKQKLFFLVSFLLCAPTIWAQSETRSAEAEVQHLLLVSEFANQHYEKAIAAGEKELQLLRQQEGKTDSLQIEMLPCLGRAYFKLGQVDKAIEMNREGVALCLKNNEECTSRLAVMYDNMAFYHTFSKQYAEALSCSKKAVDIYYKLLSNDQDMAGTLMHAAECAYHVGQYADAVLYEEHACNLYSEVYGEHNDTYLEELDYLIKYYKAADQNEKAAATEELQKRLKEEQKYGYIPMPADLSTAEKCGQHDEDAYFASLYFNSHIITADSMIFVGKYIFNYVLNSDRVHAISGIEESKWMKDKNAFSYLIAYFSGFVTYQLENPEKEASLASYKYAINNLLNFYARNKSLLGEVKTLEDYLKLYAKSPEKLIKKIEKDYEAQQKGKHKSMEVEQKGNDLIIH
jgi:tetratricopeptide (TPR) repeat protein